MKKPVLIRNIKKPLEVQQTNAISGGIIALIVIGIIIILGFGIKMHRRIENQISKLKTKITEIQNKKKGGSELKSL